MELLKYTEKILIFLSTLPLKDILIGVVSSILASLFTTGVLIYFFRTPNFELNLNYIPGKQTEKGYQIPTLDVSVLNKKKYLGFLKDEIFFGLVLPINFIENKKLFLITPEGSKEWLVDTRGKENFTVNNENYYLYRGMVSLPVYPGSRVLFLRITGDFKKEELLKFYYYFETQYGNFPSYLKTGERVKNIVSGLLPYVEIPLSDKSPEE